MHRLVFALAFVFLASTAHAEKDVDMTGKWACDPAPILIRGEWTKTGKGWKLFDRDVE